jgi:hypothetical protein
MLQRAVTDTVSGILGASKFGNWPYFTASLAWNFVRARHGGATDRVERLKAYSGVRRWLALDRSLDPGLRMELQRRLEILGVNPLEKSVFAEADIARRQYAALLRYADDPGGLAPRLAHDRETEMTAYRHGWQTRTALDLASVVSLGAYKHRESASATPVAALDRERRAERQVRFLETVARSSPQTDVVWNMDEVKRALDQLSATGFRARSAEVVERLLRQTSDEETRELCRQALQSLNEAGQ